MLKIFLLGLLLIFFSCNNPEKSSDSVADSKKQTNETYPARELLIDNGDEEGWGGDIKLSIVSFVETDTSNLYTVQSTYQGNNLGLLVSIPKQKEAENGFASGIVLKSIGSESDSLLMTLAKLYKQPVDASLKFTNALSLAYVNLDMLAKQLGAKDDEQYKTENQYKLFFEGENENDYAEIYLNINTSEHWIELKEKDEEYRTAIIKFLKR